MEEFWRAMAPIAIALIAAIPGILAYQANRARMESEADTSAAGAWREMLEPLRVRLQEVEAEMHAQRVIVENQAKRIAVLEEENQQLLAGVTLLVNQLRATGQRPIWEYQPPQGGVLS